MCAIKWIQNNTQHSSSLWYSCRLIETIISGIGPRARRTNKETPLNRKTITHSGIFRRGGFNFKHFFLIPLLSSEKTVQVTLHIINHSEEACETHNDPMTNLDYSEWLICPFFLWN